MMGLSRRKFTREFKLSVVKRLEMGFPVAEMVRAIEVNANTLRRWRKEHLENAGNAFPGPGREHGPHGRIGKLERKMGQQVLEIDSLKGRLQRIEDQLQASSGKPPSTSRSKGIGKKKKTA